MMRYCKEPAALLEIQRQARSLGKWPPRTSTLSPNRIPSLLGRCLAGGG